MPQRGIETYCRPKIAPRAHFLVRRVVLPTASWIVFASDVMSGCHVFYGLPQIQPASVYSNCTSLREQVTTVAQLRICGPQGIQQVDTAETYMAAQLSPHPLMLNSLTWTFSLPQERSHEHFLSKGFL